MLTEKYTIVENTKCTACGEVTECFQHYELTAFGPQVWLTRCGPCDPTGADPRNAEAAEDLQNPEMWRA